MQVLAESYINAAICSIQYMNDTNNALAREHFTAAIDLLQSRGIDNPAMIAVIVSHLQQINTHVLSPDDNTFRYHEENELEDSKMHHNDNHISINNCSENGVCDSIQHGTTLPIHNISKGNVSMASKHRRIQYLKRRRRKT